VSGDANVYRIASTALIVSVRYVTSVAGTRTLMNLIACSLTPSMDVCVFFVLCWPV
jgi:hypothetical protein